MSSFMLSKVMKLFVTAGILFMSLYGNSQTLDNPKTLNSSILRQFLWGYSKNTPALGENALIDFDVIDNWRQLGWYLALSDNGKYFAYNTTKPNGTRNWYRRQDSLVIQSTYNNWRKSFHNSAEGFFTSDSKHYVFVEGGNLYLLQLGSSELKNVKNIGSFKASGNKYWIAYKLKDTDSLVLQNLHTREEAYFVGVSECQFSKNGKWLTVEDSSKHLMLYNLHTGKKSSFSCVDSYSFSDDDEHLLLTTTEKNVTQVTCIKVSGMEPKIVWTNSKAMEGLPNSLKFSEATFTNNSRYIKLSLQSRAEGIKQLNDDMVGVEVWNHKDLNLQSLQARQVGGVKSYTAILNMSHSDLVFLESDNKKLQQLQGDFAVVKNDYRDVQGDRFWEGPFRHKEDSTWIVNLKDGKNTLLTTGYVNQYWFSPFGNYLIYFNAAEGCQYYSYDLRTNVSKRISFNVPKNQLGIFDRYRGDAKSPTIGWPAAWMENDRGLLVYDNYDIWQLDLTGKNPAINITNGFGQANTIVLSLLNKYRCSGELPLFRSNESLILQAYNTSNKQNGFYSKQLGVPGNPIILSIGNYYVNFIDGSGQDANITTGFEPRPTKAKNSNYWIVQRQSESDASNYFATTDFQSFKRLTNVQPHKNYEWLSQELVSFKHLDGKIGQGVLYKPENFDPAKKYPLLIAFYGAFSDNLYQFHPPAYINQAMQPGMSPIWFLNNGYLVFTPDIYVEPLKYGPKAFSVIEGAAQYLRTLSYVDGNKLGCASHSWSAKLGAYIFTHSKTIAASTISEGFLYGNVINHALSYVNNQSILQGVEEAMQFGSLWQNKESWLDQTTVLNADKAEGALLLRCYKECGRDYIDQTFQIFNALRRLNKNVWWLNYDNGDHQMQDLKELKDYTTRYTQFFDHYLKNSPAPQWMTQGIPYKLKGIESRYQLDPQGTCNSVYGEPCFICQAWNAQYKRTPQMFQKEIREWNLDKDIAEELRQKEMERRKELDKAAEATNAEVLKKLNER